MVIASKKSMSMYLNLWYNMIFLWSPLLVKNNCNLFFGVLQLVQMPIDNVKHTHFCFWYTGLLIFRSLWRMLRFVKDYALYVHLAYKDDDLFSERFGPRVPENLQNEQSSYSFSPNKPLRVPASSYYKNTATTDLKNKL